MEITLSFLPNKHTRCNSINIKSRGTNVCKRAEQRVREVTERAEAGKGNRRDSERHGIGWEKGRDEEQKKKMEGQIPGLCSQDEFESM